MSTSMDPAQTPEALRALCAAARAPDASARTREARVHIGCYEHSIQRASHAQLEQRVRVAGTPTAGTRTGEEADAEQQTAVHVAQLAQRIIRWLIFFGPAVRRDLLLAWALAVPHAHTTCAADVHRALLRLMHTEVIAYAEYDDPRDVYHAPDAAPATDVQRTADAANTVCVVYIATAVQQVAASLLLGATHNALLRTDLARSVSHLLARDEAFQGAAAHPRESRRRRAHNETLVALCMWGSNLAAMLELARAHREQARAVPADTARAAEHAADTASKLQRTERDIELQWAEHRRDQLRTRAVEACQAHVDALTHAPAPVAYREESPRLAQLIAIMDGLTAGSLARRAHLTIARYLGAVDRFTDAAERFALARRCTDDPTTIALAFVDEARVYRHPPQVHARIACFGHAATYFAQAHDFEGVICCRRGIAHAHSTLANYHDAAYQLTLAARILADWAPANARWEGILYAELGAAQAKIGPHERAIETLTRALAALRQAEPAELREINFVTALIHSLQQNRTGHEAGRE